MKTILCCLLLLISASAHASLGETIAQCKARYGEEVSRSKNNELITFHKREFVILAFFDDQLLCEKLIFCLATQEAMSPEVKTFLVQGILGKKVTKESAGINEFWTDNLTGCAFYAPQYNALTFMNIAAAEEYSASLR